MVKSSTVGAVVIGVAAAAAIGIGLVYATQGQPPPPPGTVNTDISAVGSPNPSQVGQTVTVSGTISRSDTHAGIGAETIIIESATSLFGPWTQVTTTVSDASGGYSAAIQFTVAGTFYVRARFAGGPVV